MLTKTLSKYYVFYICNIPILLNSAYNGSKVGNYLNSISSLLTAGANG